MANKLYKFHRDFGRMGDLEGIFIEDEELVKKLIEVPYKVYFGEVLGKHSEVYCKINSEDITEITSDENVLKVVSEYGLMNGYDPFGYEFLGLDYDELGLDDDIEYSVLEVLRHMINNEKKN